MSRPHIERLQSLDLFRGLTMLFLLAEGTNLYYFLNVAVPENSIFQKVTIQLYHAEWHGMRFWDLIQPYFTFIIGLAMAFSLSKRWGRGDSWLMTFKHILFRCFVLFFLGIVIQSGYRGKMVWELWNILTQFSFSILITFLIFKFRNSTQLIFSFSLLLVTELLYRFVSIEGYDQPFIIHRNFGSFMDILLMGKTNPDGWVAINFIPDTAHMIWGAMAGNLLLKSSEQTQKVKILGLAGIIGLFGGYGMDWMGITPIIKHISTASFVIVSGGWSFLTFAILYWLVDVKGYKRWITFFSVIGMNPIFIYTFSRTIGRMFLNSFIAIFVKGFLDWFRVSDGIINFATYMAILGFEWYLCYWLYKRKILIKI